MRGREISEGPPAGRGRTLGLSAPSPDQRFPLWTPARNGGGNRIVSGDASQAGLRQWERQPLSACAQGHGQPWLTVGFRMIVAGKTGFSGRESSRKPISAVHALIPRPGFASRKAQRMCACKTSRTGCRDDVPARRRPPVRSPLQHAGIQHTH